jgi:hypothetical protein
VDRAFALTGEAAPEQLRESAARSAFPLFTGPWAGLAGTPADGDTGTGGLVTQTSTRLPQVRDERPESACAHPRLPPPPRGRRGLAGPAVACGASPHPVLGPAWGEVSLPDSGKAAGGGAGITGGRVPSPLPRRAVRGRVPLAGPLGRATGAGMMSGVRFARVRPVLREGFRT